MNFHILTLFPDMVRDGLHTSILGRAAENGHISMNVVNIRDYTLDKHKDFLDSYAIRTPNQHEQYFHYNPILQYNNRFFFQKNNEELFLLR